jgi:hypothetical protein
MKRLLRLPKFATLSLALFLAGTIIFSETGCGPKPACGTKRDHRIRKKRVHKFAPSMGMNKAGLKNKEIYFS